MSLKQRLKRLEAMVGSQGQPVADGPWPSHPESQPLLAELAEMSRRQPQVDGGPDMSAWHLRDIHRLEWIFHRIAGNEEGGFDGISHEQALVWLVGQETEPRPQDHSPDGPYRGLTIRRKGCSMRAKQRLERLEKAAPACPACHGTGTRRGASKTESEAEAWFADLDESERRDIIGREYRLAMMGEEELEALVARLRQRDAA
ncbi:MAG: hypothetical protein ACYCW6_17220 [Candidatus Xenobia bacterium]